VAGLVGCVGDGDFIPYKMSGKDVEPEDVSAEDLPTGDYKEPDWNVQGGIPWPEDVRDDGQYLDYVLPGKITDIEGDGSCPLPDLKPWELAGVAPPDVEEEFPPLAGDPRPPEDVISEELPPLAGDMPMPDVVEAPDAGSAGDAKGEVDSEFPPLDGDMAWPEEK
jgi:hypothetical protein